MIILMPMSAKIEDKGELINLDKVSVWGIFDLMDGKVQKVDYFDNWSDYKGMIEVVVVADKNDYIWPFIEESIPVLEAPVQRKIDDVIEAFLFKELYEVNV